MTLERLVLVALVAVTIQNRTGEFGLHPALSVFYDPPPENHIIEEIDELKRYCLGGGFTDDFDGVSSVATLIEPAPAGSYYSDLEKRYVVAKEWNLSEGEFTVRANLGEHATLPGIYTIVVFSDDEESMPLVEAMFVRE